MTELRNLENKIQEDVEGLREQFPNTRDLYREVCALLFFRYGITPTTNKLYQFVRKGSMSIPTEALSNFWTALREKSKIRIEQTDLPQDLKDVAGEAIEKIWVKAQYTANESLSALRAEIETKETALLKKVDLMTVKRDVAIEKQQATEEKLLDKKSAIETLEKRLFNAENKLSKNTVEIEGLHQCAKERENNHQHALSLITQDINREQSRASKLSVELDTSRVAHKNSQEQHKVDIKGLEKQLSDSREYTGELKGKFQLLKSTNLELNALLEEKEQKLKDIIFDLANPKVREESWIDRIQKRQSKRRVYLKR